MSTATICHGLPIGMDVREAHVGAGSFDTLYTPGSGVLHP